MLWSRCRCLLWTRSIWFWQCRYEKKMRIPRIWVTWNFWNDTHTKLLNSVGFSSFNQQISLQIFVILHDWELFKWKHILNVGLTTMHLCWRWEKNREERLPVVFPCERDYNRTNNIVLHFYRSLWLITNIVVNWYIVIGIFTPLLHYPVMSIPTYNMTSYRRKKYTTFNLQCNRPRGYKIQQYDNSVTLWIMEFFERCLFTYCVHVTHDTIPW